MPEKWTGKIVGKMHVEEITNIDIAKEMGVSPSYVSMILNSTRTPATAKERVTNALEAIIERKKG